MKSVDPYQQRAEWKAGRIEVGEKNPAPRHVTEQRAREEAMSRQEVEEIKRVGHCIYSHAPHHHPTTDITGPRDEA